MNQVSSPQFESLFLNDTHWIDVRAPIEFETGAVPGALNLPLLMNEERHEIGIAYKKFGKEAAIELGHRLISGEKKEGRIQSWSKAIQKHPNSIIYCFRGGLRSQITQTWIREAGIDRPLVVGGYKALRQFLIQTLEEKSKTTEFITVSGPTGSGKTKYLYQNQKPFIDLEEIANHRGSAFGAKDIPQPSQANFENKLAIELLRQSKCNQPILIENESRKIGGCYIPDVFYEKIKTSPKLTIDVSLDQRVENIFQDYILESSLGRDRNVRQFDEFRNSVQAISKKLGGIRTKEIIKDIDRSEKDFTAELGLDFNRIWIRKLLTWYYDPLYKGQYPIQSSSDHDQNIKLSSA